eukprot:1688440-Rhodomonas_salina.1
MSTLDSPGVTTQPPYYDDGAGVFVSKAWAPRTRRSSDPAVTRPPLLKELSGNVPRRPSVPEGLKPEKGSDV